MKINYQDLYQNLHELGYYQDYNDAVKYVSYLTYNYDFLSVLDVGCAQGHAVKAFQDLYRDAIGIDIAPYAIKRAEDLNIDNCICGNILSIPFRDNQFDMVVAINILSLIHPFDMEKAIQELIRVSKKYIIINSIAFNNTMHWVKRVQEKTQSFKNMISLNLTDATDMEWVNLFKKVDPHIKFNIKSDLIILEVKE